MNSRGISIIFELISIQLSFAAGFAAGRYYNHISGSLWLGLFAGVLVFFVAVWLLIKILPVSPDRRRSPETPPEPMAQPAPGPLPQPPSTFSTAVSFSIFFIIAYLSGHFVSGKTNIVWLGMAAGSLVILGIIGMFLWTGKKVEKILQNAKAVDIRAVPESDVIVKGVEDSKEPLLSLGKDFGWTEPKRYRGKELVECKSWIFKAVSITLGLTLLCVVFVNWYGFDYTPTLKVLVTGGGIVVFFIVLGFFTQVMPIGIRITDEAIRCELGEDPIVHKFKDIDHCEIGKQFVESAPFLVLVVELKNGDRETYAIDDSISAETVRSVLECRGIRTAMRAEIPGEVAQ